MRCDTNRRQDVSSSRRRGGQGRYCSNRLAGSGPNRNCTYRRNTWLGPLQPVSSFISGALRYLQRIIGSEVEKARLKAVEQSNQPQRRDEGMVLDTGSQTQARLTSPDKKELLTDMKK